MSPMGWMMLIIASVLIGLWLGDRCVKWEIARKKATPSQPPITPGYPARWIKVNGFRYVLDLCGQWRPIETAPKDGTWILGINNRGNQAVIIWGLTGWFHPFSDGRPSSFWNGGCGSVATHWMPLPAPPKDDCNRCGKPKGSAEGCCGCGR